MNALQALADSPVIERLGWTLLHSVWQAAAVAICLAAALAAVRRRGARVSYAVCCGALLLTVLLPATTFCTLPNSSSTHTSSNADAIASTVTVAEEPPRSLGRPLTPAFVSSTDRAPRTIDRRSAPPIAAGPALSTPTVVTSFRERIASLRRQISERLSLWLPCTVFVWTSGVLTLSLWNVAGWFTVQRLRSKGTSPVSAAIEQAAGRIAHQLGVARTVRLLHSSVVGSPLVIGAIKPMILLPISLATELPPDQLESLLAHELAHILRHDYLVNLLQSAIETLLFYHPAVWWISAQVRAERENCCDDLAVRVATNREVYVRALATVAGAREPKTVPAATGGSLLLRLRRIMGIADSQSTRHWWPGGTGGLSASASPQRPGGSVVRLSRCLIGVVMLVLGCVAISFLAVNTRSATAQAKTPDATSLPAPGSKVADATKAQPSSSKSREAVGRSQAATTGRMRIHVVDTAGKPLPHSQIHMNVYIDAESLARRDYTCDAEGTATVDLPKTLESFQLRAWKPGYCTESYSFAPHFSQSPIPEERTFRLVKGTVIGGVVKNENGQPIAGARVEYVPNRFNEGTLTDADGRFQFDNVRPGVKLQVRVAHPDYISDLRGGELQKEQKVTTEALRAQTATIVMRPGIHVAGKVVDPAGKPVGRALVIGGDAVSRLAGDEAPGNVVRTNADGTYQLPAFPAGPLAVSVVAEGWMPETRTIQLAAKADKANFQLKSGKKLRIRFVEPSGASVPNVSVAPRQWRGRMVFYFLGTPMVPGIDVRLPPRRRDLRKSIET